MQKNSYTETMHTVCNQINYIKNVHTINMKSDYIKYVHSIKGEKTTTLDILIVLKGGKKLH